MGGNRRWKWVALATIWTLAIMALCWLPMPIFANSDVGRRAGKIPNIDKLIHAGIFAVFALLWLRAIPGKRRFVTVCLAGAALAAVTEIVQSLPVLDRDGDVVDAAADMAGVLAACVLTYPLVRRAEAGATAPEPATSV